MTEQNPDTPREPSGAINHHQEHVAPQSDHDEVIGARNAVESNTGEIGEAPDGQPATQGPVPDEPEDMTDTGSDIGHLAPDPAAEEVSGSPTPPRPQPAPALPGGGSLVPGVTRTRASARRPASVRRVRGSGRVRGGRGGTASVAGGPGGGVGGRA